MMWDKQKPSVGVTLCTSGGVQSFISAFKPNGQLSDRRLSRLGCYSFTLRWLQSFEKSFLNYVHFDRDQQLSAAPRTCHRRGTELWDEKFKTPSEPHCTLYFKNHLFKRKYPQETLITCSEDVRLSRSHPPGQSSQTGCWGTGLSQPPGPSSPGLSVLDKQRQ